MAKLSQKAVTQLEQVHTGSSNASISNFRDYLEYQERHFPFVSLRNKTKQKKKKIIALKCSSGVKYYLEKVSQMST